MPRLDRTGPFRDGMGQCLTCGGVCDIRSRRCRTCSRTRDRLICPGCRTERDRSAFRTAKGNRRSYCGTCDREWHRLRRYLVKYGLTSGQYESLLATQGGGCAICGSLTSRSETRPFLYIDHDHDTGDVRGLLCSPCNSGLGHFHDDADRLISAANYLRAKG